MINIRVRKEGNDDVKMKKLKPREMAFIWRRASGKLGKREITLGVVFLSHERYETQVNQGGSRSYVVIRKSSGILWLPVYPGQR